MRICQYIIKVLYISLILILFGGVSFAKTPEEKLRDAGRSFIDAANKQFLIELDALIEKQKKEFLKIQLAEHKDLTDKQKENLARALDIAGNYIRTAAIGQCVAFYGAAEIAVCDLRLKKDDKGMVDVDLLGRDISFLFTTLANQSIDRGKLTADQIQEITRAYFIKDETLAVFAEHLALIKNAQNLIPAALKYTEGNFSEINDEVAKGKQKYGWGISDAWFNEGQGWSDLNKGVTAQKALESIVQSLQLFERGGWVYDSARRPLTYVYPVSRMGDAVSYIIRKLKDGSLTEARLDSALRDIAKRLDDNKKIASAIFTNLNSSSLEWAARRKGEESLVELKYKRSEVKALLDKLNTVSFERENIELLKEVLAVPIVPHSLEKSLDDVLKNMKPPKPTIIDVVPSESPPGVPQMPVQLLPPVSDVGPLHYYVLPLGQSLSPEAIKNENLAPGTLWQKINEANKNKWTRIMPIFVKQDSRGNRYLETVENGIVKRIDPESIKYGNNIIAYQRDSAYLVDLATNLPADEGPVISNQSARQWLDGLGQWHQRQKNQLPVSPPGRFGAGDDPFEQPTRPTQPPTRTAEPVPPRQPARQPPRVRQQLPDGRIIYSPMEALPER